MDSPNENQTALIYAIDNEKDFLLFLRTTLEFYGYSVRDFESGKQAISSILEFQPKLVIADFLLDDISGLEVCKKTKELSPDIGTILLTGWSAMPKEDILGIVDFIIVKPYETTELLRVIRKILHGE